MTKWFLLLMACALPTAANAQRESSLAALVSEARTSNPEILAARRMADAAAARVPPAGALPDPVVSAGLMNLPANMRVAGDDMAMVTVQIDQMLPPPGLRRARTDVAVSAQRAAVADAEELEHAIVARLKSAYYEFYFIDEAAAILQRNRALLEDIAELASARFAVGRAPQQDVLRAHTEVSRLDEQLSALAARRSAALAEVNMLLQRPPQQALTAVYPARVLALAHGAPAAGAFTAAALSGGLGSGIPTLPEFEQYALEHRAALRAQQARVEEARAQVTAMQRELLPMVEVGVGYGKQPGNGMNRISAMISAPIPVFADRKHHQEVRAAVHELTAAEHMTRARAQDVVAEVTARYAEAVRIREQLLLLTQAIIPQARATTESAAAAYQAGTMEFLGLLDAHATLFRNEIEMLRQLADFGRALAALEHASGRDLNLDAR